MNEELNFEELESHRDPKGYLRYKFNCVTCDDAVWRTKDQIKKSAAGTGKFYCDKHRRQVNPRKGFEAVCELDGCDVSFYKKPSDSKRFCSISHSKLAEPTSKGTLMPKECQECAESFQPKVHTQVTCGSAKCVSKARVRNKLGDLGTVEYTCKSQLCSDPVKIVSKSRLPKTGCCSRECASAWNRQKNLTVCANGEDHSFVAKNAKQKFCSRECQARSRRKNFLAPDEKGRERKTNSDGYVVVYAPEHPRAHGTGWVLEHILVATDAGILPLNSTLEVHHDNENRLDNRLENLKPQTTSDHQAEHRNRLEDLRSKIAELGYSPEEALDVLAKAKIDLLPSP